MLGWGGGFEMMVLFGRFRRCDGWGFLLMGMFCFELLLLWSVLFVRFYFLKKYFFLLEKIFRGVKKCVLLDFGLGRRDSFWFEENGRGMEVF